MLFHNIKCNTTCHSLISLISFKPCCGMREIKLFRTCGYWKIINFREITTSYNAGVDYFPLTAYPVMFYSLHITSMR